MSKIGEAASDNIVHLKTKAESTAKSASDFVREHPLLVLAGGVAVGVIAGALLPRGVGRRLAHRASTLAEIGAAAAATFGTQALERAETAREAAGDFGKQAWDRAETTASAFGKRAETTASTLGKRGEAAAGDALAAASETGHRIARKAAELAARVRH